MYKNLYAKPMKIFENPTNMGKAPYKKSLKELKIARTGTHTPLRLCLCLTKCDLVHASEPDEYEYL